MITDLVIFAGAAVYVWMVCMSWCYRKRYKE